MPLEIDVLEAPFRGMNQNADREHIPEFMASYIQDGLCDIEGRVRRRGPLVADTTSILDWVPIATTVIPTKDGNENLLTLGYDNNGGGNATLAIGLLYLISDSGEGQTTVASTTSTIDHLYGWISNAPSGEVIFGTSPWLDSFYDVSNDLFSRTWLYAGGAGGGQTIGTNVSTTQGSTTVTGSGTTFTSDVDVGMYLSNNTGGQYIGRVKSVDSDTSLTLETGAWATLASITARQDKDRPFLIQHGKGLITTDTASTTVTGVNTKFKSCLDENDVVGPTSWDLYKRDTGEFIGSVSSIADETTLTLGGVAAIAMTNEAFIARPDNTGSNASVSTFVSGSKWVPGVIPASWAGRQWYMNVPNPISKTIKTEVEDGTNRVVFSAPDNIEDIDWSPDGDWFNLPSNNAENSPIIGAVGTDRALLIFKRGETVAITGRTPSEFTPDVVLSDGILHPSAYTAYGEGAVWAGRNNIYLYDGTSIQPLLTESMGDYYTELVENIVCGNASDHSGSVASLNVYRDHVFLFLDNANPPRGITKESSTTTDTSPTLVINLANGAVSFFTNFGLRGFGILNEDAGRVPYGVFNEQTLLDAQVVWADLSDIFELTGNDDFDSENMTTGPDFYVETRAWAGNSEFTKTKLKRIRPQYLSAGGVMTVDILTGKDKGDITSTKLADLSASTTFTYDDILLSPTVDEIVALRFYEGASVTDCSIGETMLLFKTQRATRT